jgi:ribosome-binding factor A
MSYSRIDRVQSLLTKEIANIISHDIKDPFIDSSLVNITCVTPAKDLSYCRVFISTLVEGRQDRVLKVLQDKSGFVRKLLGKRLHLKKIPQVHFLKDETLAYATKINYLLNTIKKEENE